MLSLTSYSTTPSQNEILYFKILNCGQAESSSNGAQALFNLSTALYETLLLSNGFSSDKMPYFAHLQHSK